MGRDGLYELLGVVWLLDGEEYRAKLIKEALKRASGEEKQQYAQMQQRKAEIYKRLQEIDAAQQTLNLRDTQNVLPQKPSSNRAPDRSAKTLGLPSRDPSTRRQEAADYDAKRQQYKTALQVYHTQNSMVLSERLKLMGEYLALQSEYAALEEDEKWLLLSMAIKNQSSLMGYMHVDDKK